MTGSRAPPPGAAFVSASTDADAGEPLIPGPPSAELLDGARAGHPVTRWADAARAWAALKQPLLAGFLAAAAAAAVLLAAAAVYAAFQRAGS